MKLNMQAGEMQPDGPKVEQIATAIADHFITHPSLLPNLPVLRTRNDGAVRRELLHHHGEDRKPAWGRMTALIEANLRAAGIDIP